MITHDPFVICQSQKDINEAEIESNIPNETALKIYFDSAEDSNDWAELEAIDDQLTAQGARYPVYQWVHKPDWPLRAKFEQFLRDKKDLNRNGFSGSGIPTYRIPTRIR